MAIKLKLKKSRSKEWKPNRYFESDILIVDRLVWDVKEALKEAETTIGNRSLTMVEVKKIIEEKVMEKLNPYQDIKEVQFHFSDRVIEDVSNNAITSRTYLDATNILIISIAKGPQVQFDVYADYTITVSGNNAYVTNFKLKNVELSAIFF